MTASPLHELHLRNQIALLLNSHLEQLIRRRLQVLHLRQLALADDRQGASRRAGGNPIIPVRFVETFLHVFTQLAAGFHTFRHLGGQPLPFLHRGFVLELLPLLLLLLGLGLLHSAVGFEADLLPPLAHLLLQKNHRLVIVGNHVLLRRHDVDGLVFGLLRFPAYWRLRPLNGLHKLIESLPLTNLVRRRLVVVRLHRRVAVTPEQRCQIECLSLDRTVFGLLAGEAHLEADG